MVAHDHDMIPIEKAELKRVTYERPGVAPERRRSDVALQRRAGLPAQAPTPPVDRRRRSAARKIRREDGQALVANSCLILCSLALGCLFLGELSSGHEVIPVLITGGLGLLAVALWYLTTAEYVFAWIYGGLATFNATWVIVQLAVTNNWFAIDRAEIPAMMTVYMTIWILIFGLGAIAASRRSLALAAVLCLAIIGLALDIASYHSASTEVLRLVSVPMFLIGATSIGAIANIVLA